MTPEHSISNEELVASYNAYAERYNAENAAAMPWAQETSSQLSPATS